MNIMKKNKIIILLAVISCLSLFLLYNISIRPYDIEIMSGSGETKKIERLPFFEESKTSNNKYIFKGKINLPSLFPKFLHITPDNCLEYIKINGANVPIQSSNNDLCNYREGFNIEAGNYFRKGPNEFEIKVKDYGGKYGLNIKNTQKDSVYYILFILALPILLLPFFLLLKYLLPDKSNKEKILMAIIIGATALRIFYLSYTDYNLRSHDVEGHIDYIDYIVTNHSLPKTNQCWQCYQPPTYYITAALVSQFSQFINLNSHFGLQIFSLILSFLFLVFSVKVVRKIILNDNLQILAVSVIAFWPSGIIHSIRIGNDSLFYLFYAIGFYYLIKWYQKENSKDFYLTSIFSFISLLIKSNGLILISIFIIAFLYKFIKSTNRTSLLKKGLFFMVILAIGLALAFYRPLMSISSKRTGDLFVGNIKSLNGALLVNNDLKNYLWFDMPAYFKESFTYPWEDKGGRQYYWNYLMKTSIFGEFEFNNFKYAPILANYMSWTLLFAIFFFFVSLILIFLKENLKNIRNCNFVLFVSIITPLAFSIAMRARLPFSPTGDFRYIFPVLVPFASLYALGLRHFKFKNKKGNILKHFAYSPFILMPILTIAFFIVISGIFN